MYITAKNKELAGKPLAVKRGLHLKALVLAFSVVLTLIGIFAISGWAEASAFNHGVQHVIIFVSGAGFGGSLLAGYFDRKVSSDES
ncbi:MAG TPA: hypothetical protein VLF90_04565 [Patescibacteria group bacterium]|nr:hypothetical protein [Patescibacteria group bacterium]